MSPLCTVEACRRQRGARGQHGAARGRCAAVGVLTGLTLTAAERQSVAHAHAAAARARRSAQATPCRARHIDAHTYMLSELAQNTHAPAHTLGPRTAVSSQPSRVRQHCLHGMLGSGGTVAPVARAVASAAPPEVM